MIEYPAFISPEPDGTFRVDIPDFPKCMATGKTREAALETAQMALKRLLNEARSMGREVAEPTPAKKLAIPHGADLVTLAAPRSEETPALVTLALPRDVLEAMEKAALDQGIPRDEFMVRVLAGAIEE